MRTYIIIIMFIYSNSMIAQMHIDTIYANEKKNVALFFPNPIRQAITGTSHFVFNYNREKEQYFGLLQATPGFESNLLTITKDGKVYSYILKYSNILPKLNYFILESKSIGNEKPSKINLKPIDKPTNDYTNRLTYFHKFSEFLLNLKPKKLATKRKSGMLLRLQKVVYNVSEVYLVLEVENRSLIDFEIDYLNIFKINGNKKRKASYQRLEQKVIFKYKEPSVIKYNQSLSFVYIISKFVLGENEEISLELKELNGDRNIILNTKL
ncbi:MAG: DUF4138 domain-containing protein [Lutibacter sp.]|uniref:DUF4138 domain-containing protein n=1 Tax=Lutibacter sp. TaxID=1925666 RepID=UPI00299F2899|nr:DUF4138 domain-containing protein [Lutibacter sp.]MDX1829326.1 DUF4138 domain-containing protein [Lutibacter sp.]